MTDDFLNNKDLKDIAHCNTCDTPDSKFNLPDTYWGLREDFYCTNCQSRPRERALFDVINKLYPEWHKLKIHESSPVMRGTSRKIHMHNKDYSFSQFFPGKPLGQKVNKIRNEDLEALTFEDETFDLIITQDVMENIFHPKKAFAEIARVLKKGGAHIFTVPIINQEKPTEVAAKINRKGDVKHLLEPEYHGNPVDDNGSLVTYRWGFDITDFILKSSKLHSTIYFIDNPALAIRGLFSEVIVSRKY